MLISMDTHPQIEVLDFVRLMKDFLDRRIDVQQYQRGYVELNAKRIIVSDEEAKSCNRLMGIQTISTTSFS